MLSEEARERLEAKARRLEDLSRAYPAGSAERVARDQSAADLRAAWAEITELRGRIDERSRGGGDGEWWARRFHETYERLAPSFGYETRAETRQFDPMTPNGRLMIAVCADLLGNPPPGPAPGASPLAFSDEAVERAARAIHDARDQGYPWFHEDFAKCRHSRELARAALASLETKG